MSIKGKFPSSMRVMAALLLAVVALGGTFLLATARPFGFLSAQVPPMINYQGYLADTSGNPLSGAVTMDFSLYTVQSGGSPVWQELDKSVIVDNGYFTTLLGSQTPLDVADFEGGTVYLEVKVGETAAFERQPLTSVPYALFSMRAITASVVSWAGVAGVPQGSGDISGTYPVLDVTGLQGMRVMDTEPQTDQVLRFNGEAWQPGTIPLPDLPPVAVLKVSPSTLYMGEGGVATATLSMTLSYDPDGTVLEYAFDPEGTDSGAPDTYILTPTLQTSYAESGDYLAAGWVRDTAGNLNLAQARVSVYQFRSQVIDRDGDVGRYASLVMVEDRPAVAYYDASSLGKDLKYVRAEDHLGREWGEPVRIESGTGIDVGQYAALAVVDGQPAIAYQDSDRDWLKYVRATDGAGISWSTPVSVDVGGGINNSMAVIDGRPAIAYYDPAGQALKYVRAGGTTGMTWTQPITVVQGVNITQLSLAEVQGGPAIAFYDSDGGDLEYVYSTDPEGLFWNATTPASEGNVGQYASLAVVAGNPAIAYYDVTNKHLMYIRSRLANGSSWGTGVRVTVDDGWLVGQYASLAVVDGLPAIAYASTAPGAGALKFAWALDAEGNTWGEPFVVDSTGAAGQVATSLVDMHGRPAIGYYNPSDSNLRFSTPRR